jgi:electron transfer flavoprotein alpha subunit
MSTLVFLEHHENTLTKGSLGVLGKAHLLGNGDVAAVLMGGQPLKEIASEAGKFGAATVYIAEDPALDAPLPQPRVDVLHQVIRAGSYDTILFSNSVLAADVAAGLAARLDAGLNWDLLDIVESNGRLIGKRPALQDSVVVDVGWRSEQRIALFRTGSFDPVPVAASEPRVEYISAQFEQHSLGVSLVGQQARADEGASIEDAEIIVAGGMGLGAAEHFSLAEELATVLGGVVGATRAAVYAGWYPYSAQIGQTGKTVSPRLYIALGISGAVQHKVGMQNSKVIVAINKDPRAPIFDFSDLSVVGDVHAIIPTLMDLLRQRNGPS